MISSCRRDELVDRIKSEVPAAAGVYTFYNQSGTIIYIGKSVNLRNRLLSYFRQHYDRAEPRIGRMIRQIVGYDFETTGGELEALLREDELIKAARPEHNIRQNQFRQYRYLRFSGDRVPRLEAVIYAGQPRSGRLYGPFPDRYFADRLINISCRYLMLRACPDPEPKDKCLNYGLGHCLGPCRRAIAPGRYERVVEQVETFLRGEEGFIAGRIELAMAAAASQRRYEDAAGHRNHLEFCKRFCTRQRFVQRFKKGKLTLLGDGDSAAAVFIRGDLFGGNERPDRIRYRPGSINAKALQADDRFASDRANIVYDWIRKHGCRYVFEDDI